MTDLLGAASSYISDVLFSFGTRGIGTLIPSVVVEEGHDDELVVTEHPVEKTADITDHAYWRPAQLRLTYGWSPSAPLLPGPLGTILPISQGLSAGVSQLFSGGGDYLTNVYATLLSLQRSRIPQKINTGKRRYENMVCRRLSLLTDRQHEYSMRVEMHWQEIIVVSVQTSQASAPLANQTAPQQTAAPVQQGTQAPKPAGDQSIAYSIFHSVFGK